MVYFDQCTTSMSQLERTNNMLSIHGQDVRVESGGGPRPGAGRHHDPHPAGRAAAQAQCPE